jgi:hypothetical protein
MRPLTLSPTLRAAIIAAAGGALAESLAREQAARFPVHPEDLSHALSAAASHALSTAIRDGDIALADIAERVIDRKLDADVDFDKLADDAIVDRMRDVDIDKSVSSAMEDLEDELKVRLDRLDMHAVAVEALTEMVDADELCDGVRKAIDDRVRDVVDVHALDGHVAQATQTAVVGLLCNPVMRIDVVRQAGDMLAAAVAQE